MRPVQYLGDAATIVAALAAACGVTAGCGASHESADPADASSAAPEASHSTTPPDGGGDGGCARGVLPLVVTTRPSPLGTSLDRVLVKATLGATNVAFQIDTGSARSFVHEQLRDGGTTALDDVTQDGGRVTLGCDTLTLPGLGVAPSAPADGLVVAGTMGDDLLLRSPLKLDIDARRAEWAEPGAPLDVPASWSSTGFDRPAGYVHVKDVSLDGTTVQLLVDTGSPDTLWVGQQPQPGDVEVDGVDSDGDVLKMYLGTATLVFGGQASTIPIYRVPSFPYMQQLADRIQLQLDGLLGLSAFRAGIVFDPVTQTVHIAPLTQ